MTWFRRTRPESSTGLTPTPFIAEVLRRIGEEYGGFDTISPIPPERHGPGMEVAFHIAGEPDPGRAEFSQGTGILRTARVFADHTEVYDDERLIARFEDLTTDHVVGARPLPHGPAAEECSATLHRSRQHAGCAGTHFSTSVSTC